MLKINKGMVSSAWISQKKCVIELQYKSEAEHSHFLVVWTDTV
jgi:hypothetical protein